MRQLSTLSLAPPLILVEPGGAVTSRNRPRRRKSAHRPHGGAHPRERGGRAVQQLRRKDEREEGADRAVDEPREEQQLDLHARGGARRLAPGADKALNLDRESEQGRCQRREQERRQPEPVAVKLVTEPAGSMPYRKAKLSASASATPKSSARARVSSGMASTLGSDDTVGACGCAGGARTGSVSGT